jgi:hypothetical protein
MLQTPLGLVLCNSFVPSFSPHRTVELRAGLCMVRAGIPISTLRTNVDSIGSREWNPSHAIVVADVWSVSPAPGTTTIVCNCWLLVNTPPSVSTSLEPSARTRLGILDRGSVDLRRHQYRQRHRHRQRQPNKPPTPGSKVLTILSRTISPSAHLIVAKALKPDLPAA